MTFSKRVFYIHLEGYLYPKTYVFYDKSTTIEKVTKEMLDYMDQQLTPYKDSITKLGCTPHQFLTLCSVVEENLYLIKIVHLSIV